MEEKLLRINNGNPLESLTTQYFDALLEGKRHVASELILDAVNQGISIKDIYINVFQQSLYEIGRLWELNKVDVATEHYFSAATQLIMSQLYPWIFANRKNGYKFVAANVSNELHEIGLRMVADFMEMDGWDTYYIGANTPTESIINTLVAQKPHVLGISATMGFHIEKVKTLIELVRGHEECQQVKIIVGGYGFNQSLDLWQRIGADGYGRNAQEAVEVANRLVQE